MGQKGKCRQDQKPQPFPQGKVGGAEGCRQKRDLRNRNLQQEARRERQQHQSVSQMIHTENRLFHVPHADGVKKLGHAKDRKGIGLRPAQYRLVLKDHGEGGSIVGYKPQDGDRIVIIEDVITAGTAVRETMPILKACAGVKVPHMFISVDRCEVGQTPGKTAIMEVEEEFGVKVHPIVTVVDIHEYLQQNGTDPELLKAMEGYMEQYCVL